MLAAQYRELHEVERTYWWHVGRLGLLRALLDQHLPQARDLRILDFGCGTGVTLELLLAYGEPVGADVSEEALSYCARNEALRGRVQLREVPASARLPFDDARFDLITALDVLEHVDDDGALLGEFRRILAPGGLLVAFVPAFRFLWSRHDEVLGHRRRYLASELARKVSGAGLDVLRSTYAVSAVFPLVAGTRLLSGLRDDPDPKTSYVRLPRLLNQTLVGVLELESALIRHVRMPVGSTAVVVARKPSERLRNGSSGDVSA